MSTFTILSVEPETRRWGDKNDMIAYRVQLSGEQGRSVGEKGVELSRHEKAPPPRPDEVVDGELKEYPPHGWKLVKPKGAKPAFNGGGASGGWTPKKEKEIVRQHSQKVAMQYVTAKVYLKALDDFTVEDVCKIAAAFQADVEGHA